MTEGQIATRACPAHSPMSFSVESVYPLSKLLSLIVRTLATEMAIQSMVPSFIGALKWFHDSPKPPPPSQPRKGGPKKYWIMR
jgi:hypothetical protein